VPFTSQARVGIYVIAGEFKLRAKSGLAVIAMDMGCKKLAFNEKGVAVETE